MRGHVTKAWRLLTVGRDGCSFPTLDTCDDTHNTREQAKDPLYELIMTALMLMRSFCRLFRTSTPSAKYKSKIADGQRGR